MSAIASLEPTAIRVDPGTQATVTLRIRNGGTIVERFDVAVVGPTAGWARIDPVSLSLFPGQEGIVRVTFAPPRASVPRAGTLPFGVRVVPASDPAAGTVEEGRVTVGPFVEVAAEVVPQTSRGSREGRHEVVLRNVGNAPVEVAIGASDPDRLLSFEVATPRVVVGPGDETNVGLRVRPIETSLLGQARSIPFAVEVGSAGTSPASYRATFAQRPLLPSWALPAAGALAAGVVALLILPGLLGSNRPTSGADPNAGPTPTPTATASASTSGPPGSAPASQPPPSVAPASAPPPTAAPPATPSAPQAVISITRLQLEDPSNPGSRNPTFEVVSDGPGPLVVGVERLVDFSGEGVRVCIEADPGGRTCEELTERGFITVPSDRPSTTWTVSVDGIASGFAPGIDLRFEFFALRPALTYRDSALIDGTETSGFTALVPARGAGGTLGLDVDFGEIFPTFGWSIRDANEIGTPPPLTMGGPISRFSIPPVGLTAGRTYELTFRAVSQTQTSDPIEYSATITWP